MPQSFILSSDLFNVLMSWDMCKYSEYDRSDGFYMLVK